MEIRFLGHACFELREGDTTILIDPFLTGNPKAPLSADDVSPTHILLTHGHVDHLGDTVALAKRTGAPVVAVVELARELAGDGVPSVFDPNIGGTVKFDWGWVKLQPAIHTAVTSKGTPHIAAGLLVHVAGTTIYHLGDTALFSDLALVARRGRLPGDAIDVALMCIGGHYTMDRLDAVIAAQLIAARTVIPCHYGTFPVLNTDVQAFKSDVESQTASRVVVLEPGETHAA